MFVYYFKNYYDEIIYVGKTKDIKTRMKQHFTSGHLPAECYQNVAHIFYADVGISQYDAEIIETLLINKYKPIFNTEKLFYEQSNKTHFQIPDLKWKELFISWYPEFKTSHLNTISEIYKLRVCEREKAKRFLMYNIEKMKHQKGFYEYYIDFSDYPEFLNDMINLYTEAISYINTEKSDIDEPLSHCDAEFSTFIAINNGMKCVTNFENIILAEEIGFFIKENDILAIPLHSDHNLHIISKRFDIYH